MTAAQHTPLPWHRIGNKIVVPGDVERHESGAAVAVTWIRDDDEYPDVTAERVTGVAWVDSPEEAEANAAFILRAVNAHPDLLAYAECVEAYSHARSSNDWMSPFHAAGWDHKQNPTKFLHAMRRAAIAKAKGGPA